ncbi:unnamed protein product [Nyctereutes procyonoides]|uniref:(raccoon dog) hypothetical protein n=1 Tax=Nyctereutes procyonoides TaxID=34880 RepID=A0A811ZCG0_NYCPR|nr:unnamed protein product [Nyctereutes procyonoides]
MVKVRVNVWQFHGMIHPPSDLLPVLHIGQVLLEGRGPRCQLTSHQVTRGTAFSIIPVGGLYFITDRENGHITTSEIKASLKWKTELAWLDLQAPEEAYYCLPALSIELYSHKITTDKAREVLF